MKQSIVHFLQKYFLNPPIKFLFVVGTVPSGYALLETVGRKTGKPRRTPVGDGRVARDFGFWRNMAGKPNTSAISRRTRECV
jgi:hypothetical protein